MNIYKKLQSIRCDLQRTTLKKSGHNKFAGYEYFELGDFLPTINDLMLREGVSSFVSFTTEEAILTLVDCDKPEDRIEFKSPMSSAQLKGCHEVQNLGAVQTYLRRYLYTNAFEIVEHDALDATINNKEIVREKVEEGNELLEKVKHLILDKAKGDKLLALDILEKCTEFTGKDGNLVSGKRSFTGMTQKQLEFLFKKVSNYNA